MDIYPNESEKINPDEHIDYVPFDGFVNVNELVKNRRALQNNQDAENAKSALQRNTPEIIE